MSDHNRERPITGQIFDRHIFICTSGDWCASIDGDGLGVHQRFKKAIRDADLPIAVRVNHSGCLDQCGYGPMVVVYPDAVWYHHVSPDDVEEIVHNHIIGGRPVERLIYRQTPGKHKLKRDASNRPVLPSDARED